MKTGNKASRCRDIFIEGSKIQFTATFSYVGIVFSQAGNWPGAIKSRWLHFVKTIMALSNFARQLGIKHPRELMTIYKAKCRPTAMYGSELWGYGKTDTLQREENAFLRILLALLKSSSTYVCHSELGAPCIADLIRIQPVLLWHKIWSSEHTSSNQAIIVDCLRSTRALKIPWLKFVHKFLTDLGHPKYFNHPESLIIVPRKALKLKCLSLLEETRLSSEIIKPSF